MSDLPDRFGVTGETVVCGCGTLAVEVTRLPSVADLTMRCHECGETLAFFAPPEVLP